MQRRVIPILFFIFYSILLIEVMIFRNIPTIHIGHMMFRYGGADANGRANLIPFKTIMPYLQGKGGWLTDVINIAGNIILPLPFGFLAALVYRHMTWKGAIVLSVAFGLFIEGMQQLLHLGIFDIDDVILNGLGVMIGYLLFIRLKSFVNKNRQ